MVDSVLQTVEGLIAGVYEYVGNPPEDVLAPSIVLNSFNDKLQHYRNEMELTDEGWNIMPYTLNVQPNIEEYTIEDPSFGRPYFAETYDANNPRLRRREVKFARVQDRNLDGFQNGAPIGDTKHNARLLLFYNIGNVEPKVQVYPLPTIACQYRIWSETIITQEPRFKEVPNFLRHFFPLLKVDTAISVIPFCGYDQEKSTMLLNIRTMEKQQFYETFWAYVQETFHSDTQTMRASNSSRRNRSRWR